MKIVLLSARNSRLAGGLYNSVRNLGLALKNHCGVDVTYVCHNDEYSSEDVAAYQNLPLAIYHISKFPLLGRLGYSNDIHQVLEAEKPDVIDIQGTWMYYSYAALKYKKKHPNTKIVITPRGTLDRIDMHHLSIQKRLSYWMYEKENFETADCFHALCETEAQSMRAIGLKNPIAVISNGMLIQENGQHNRNGVEKTLLFIGRIHPKKGLKELITGVHLLHEQRPSLINEWKIRIAGWNMYGHQDELEKLVSKYELDNIISFIGPVMGNEKETELRNASAFVHTSFSEGMPMSVLEAWAYRLPVLMTDGCNIPEGFEYKAAVRVETEPDSISLGLQTIFEMTPDERGEMGNNGFNLVKSKYQWNTIAEDSVRLYQYLLNGEDKPSFVK